MPRIKNEYIPSWEDCQKLMRALISRHSKGRIPLRDLVFIGLLVCTGARLNEILALKREDFDLEARTVRIRRLKKKKIEVSELMLPAWILPLLVRYLANRRDYLFDFTDRRARDIVYKYTEEILGRRVRPHAFRHALGIRLLMSTRDLDLVRRQLGHSGYEVVKSYLNYTLRDRRIEIEEALQI